MEFFKPIEKVESVAMLSTLALEPRSIVVYNEKTHKAWNIFAKVRNTDALSICKALAKAILAEKLVYKTMHSNEHVLASKYKRSTIVDKALGGSYLFATDKHGQVLVGDKALYTGGEETLRSRFRFDNKMPVYNLVVGEALPWDNEDVSTQLDHYCRAVVHLWNYRDVVDYKIGEAANSNYQEAAKALLEAREKQRKTIEEAKKNQPAAMMQLEAAAARKKTSKKAVKGCA